MQYCPNFDDKKILSIDDVLSNVKFVSELGAGVYANVYKVIYNNKVYAAKLGNLNALLSDIKIGCLLNNTKLETGSLLLPESYLIIDSSPVFISTDNGFKYNREMWINKVKSGLILYKLLTQSLSVIKFSDENLYNDLVNNIKSIIFELLIALISMNKSGILHNDLHSGNICFEKTNNIRVYNINDQKYKIDFVYRPVLIDFGKSKISGKNIFNQAEYWKLLSSISNIPFEYYMFESFDDLFSLFNEFKSDEVMGGDIIQIYDLDLTNIKIKLQP